MSTQAFYLVTPQISTCTCIVCEQQFFTDHAETPLCGECDEHGWVYIGPSDEDPTDLVFNVLECNEIDDCPF